MSPAARAPRSFEARVVASYGRHFLVEDGAGSLYEAQRRGKRGDVVIGDRVRCAAAGNAQAAIEEILPRTTLLMRADGQRSKALAANVEHAIVVFAPRPAYSEWFVWRALIAAATAGVVPLVVLNKTDLDDDERGAHALRRLARLGYATIAVSAKVSPERTRTALLPLLQARSNLLVGQSGMGKSTLINLLVSQAGARVQEYSQRLNLGRQTTTASRLFPLDSGSIIDTPGFQAFGLAHIDLNRLAAAMPEFAPHLGRCRFSDCRHLSEPDCAVRAALAGGDVDASRYAFFVALAGELDSSTAHARALT
jgi:ribosome biogenesis GTPase